MRPWSSVLGACVAGGLLLSACAPAQRGEPGAGGRDAQDGAPQKRIVAAIKFDPPTLSTKINPATVAGVDQIEDLVNAGLAITDGQGLLRPQLAEAVPSLANGLWKVLPDGKADTTWRLRPDLRWHDGTPFTAADLIFTTTVVRDKDISVLRDRAYDLIETVEARDARSVTVRWSLPFIDADTMFTRRLAPPMPRHLLERPYADDRMSLPDHPYFNVEFVGLGPYKLKEWVGGSHLVLHAYDGYVFGRPKIDEIEIRFFPDPNVLVANIMAGAVELSLGRGISLEQALQARDQWREGKVDLAFPSWLVIYPQFVAPNPAVIADVRFRRALLHAINREELVDTIQFGMVPVAHSILRPNQPQYREIEERYLVRYEHDSQRASQLISGLGYTKGSDGMFRDSTNQPLSVEFRTITTDVNQKSLFAIADYWKRVGVGVEPVIIPTQKAVDLEYRATYPGVELLRQPPDLRGMVRYHSSQARLPERNFTGTNNPRYMNAGFDALIDRYLTAIPREERIEIIGQIIHHISDQLPLLPLFYDAEPALIGNRLVNVSATHGVNSTQTWNAHEWDVKG